MTRKKQKQKQTKTKNVEAAILKVSLGKNLEWMGD